MTEYKVNVQNNQILSILPITENGNRAIFLSKQRGGKKKNLEANLKNKTMIQDLHEKWYSFFFEYAYLPINYPLILRKL